jgi:hypothetical protein
LKWLMPHDFEPRAGHRFTFCTKPMGDWDDIAHCEVNATRRVFCAILGRAARIPTRAMARATAEAAASVSGKTSAA